MTTLLLGSHDGLAGDAAQAWRELSSLESGPARGLIHIGPIHVIEAPADLARHKAALEADLILDAVVGTGFKPPLKGLALAALQWIEGSKAPILAVDLPCGWAADETSATAAGPVFPADAVITFTAPKPAHVFGQLTRHWSQPIVVAPIGSPGEAVLAALAPDSPNLTWAGSSLALAQTPRPFAANKGSFGHVLVVGGTLGTAGGKSGAPAMAALAALRAGAGLVTAAVPAPALLLVAAIAPELMTFPLAATSAGEIAAENLAQTWEQAAKRKASDLRFAAADRRAHGRQNRAGHRPRHGAKPGDGQVHDGPALGYQDSSGDRRRCAEYSGRQAALLLTKLAKGRTLVLTPHPGEMARLAGIPVAEVQANRLDVARDFAQRTGVTAGAQGRAHAHRPPRRPRRRQHHRQSRHGQGRQRATC